MTASLILSLVNPEVWGFPDGPMLRGTHIFSSVKYNVGECETFFEVARAKAAHLNSVCKCGKTWSPMDVSDALWAEDGTGKTK